MSIGGFLKRSLSAAASVVVAAGAAFLEAGIFVEIILPSLAIAAALTMFCQRPEPLIAVVGFWAAPYYAAYRGMNYAVTGEWDTEKSAEVLDKWKGKIKDWIDKKIEARRNKSSESVELSDLASLQKDRPVKTVLKSEEKSNDVNLTQKVSEKDKSVKTPLKSAVKFNDVDLTRNVSQNTVQKNKSKPDEKPVVLPTRTENANFKVDEKVPFPSSPPSKPKIVQPIKQKRVSVDYDNKYNFDDNKPKQTVKKPLHVTAKREPYVPANAEESIKDSKSILNSQPKPNSLNRIGLFNNEQKVSESIRTINQSNPTKSWVVEKKEDKPGATLIVKEAKGNEHFKVDKDNFSTRSKDVDTFKTMLQLFVNSNDNIRPVITTTNANRPNWEKACKELGVAAKFVTAVDKAPTKEKELTDDVAMVKNPLFSSR